MNFIASLIIIATCSSVLHPLHVAYTNIEINPDKKSVSVTHKIFTQDFTILFAHLFEKNIEPKEDEDFSKEEIDLISHYMDHRFILASGTDTIRLNYLNKQLDEESLFLFFNGTYENLSQSGLSISNLLLLDLYMDQTNLVIINCKSREEGLTFNWDNREAKINMN